MPSDSDDRLRAASFDPRPSTTPNAEATEKPRQRGVWIAGAIGFLLLGFVVFILPSLTPEPKLVSRVENSGTANTESLSQGVNDASREGSERSPFAEAQLAKARRDAQEALQNLLETQARLEARSVSTWAETAFAEATEVAVEGDIFYREQNFAEAETKYRAAQTALDGIEARLPAEISARLEMLLTAIEASHAENAAALSQTLSQMAPDNADVIEAIERVPTIPEVATLIQTASDLFKQRSFEDALKQLEAASVLDPAHQRLKVLVRDYRNALTDDRFQKAMTRGFEALEADDFAAAKNAFNSAAALKPNDTSPRVALDQAEEAEILSALNRYVSNAEQQAASENWEAAATSYRAALALDPNLVQAAEGLARAEPMADLFSRLTTIVDKPARLVDPVILRDAQTTIEDARGELNDTPGAKSAMPKLDALWAKALEVVDNASTPLPVTIVSDGATEITIKRVARLGTLTSRTVSLRPGQYQLLGSRVGFRDVLMTLNVGVDRANTIEIRCTEAIGR